MRKVEGFDPGNGDWQYGMWERAGLDSEKENGDTSDDGDMDDGAMNGGRLGGLEGGWMEPEAASMCIGCHTSAADSDYTFLTYLSTER